MKYLTNYIEDAQTAAFDKAGAFFAFSNDQFEKGKKDGVVYASLGSGLICPKGKGAALMDSLDNIYKEGVAQDIKENGIKAIIKRELFNHECFYTGEIDQCVDKLADYPTTEQEIRTIFIELRPHVEV